MKPKLTAAKLITRRDRAHRLAERLLNTLSEPFDAQEKRIREVLEKMQRELTVLGEELRAEASKMANKLWSFTDGIKTTANRQYNRGLDEIRAKQKRR